MEILITGGTGLLGSHLIEKLQQLNHKITVLTRNADKAQQKLGTQIYICKSLAGYQNLDHFDAVINLAGEPIADKRWTERQKKRLCNSRWEITQKLVNLIKNSNRPPAVFISGSAVGYYGDQGENIVTEETLPHQEFQHTLCARWEEIAQGAQSNQTRVCLLRTGVILSKQGGALSKMILPFKLGLGGTIGSGRQYMPWIHIDDMVNAIVWMLEKNIQGAFNMVAPHVVNSKEFTSSLAHSLNRPALIPMPAFLLRLLMGESSVLLLGGQHALPKRLQESGFVFSWNDLNKALKNIIPKQ